MAQDKKSSDEILKELFNSIHDIAPSSEDEGGSDVDKKVVVKKEKKSKSSYDSSYCSKSKHKKKKKSKKSSTKYSLHISSGSDKKSKNKKSSSKSFSDSGRRKEKSKIKVEKELDLIEVLKKEVIDSVPCSVISAPESIDLPPLPPVGNVFIKQEPASPKKPPVKDDDVFKEPGQPILSDEAVDVKPGETSPGDGTKEDCDDETISRVADVFEEDLLESGDKLQTKGLLISEKPKKTIQIQNLKNSSVLEDAAKSKAKSDELKMKKKRKQEEGELTDDLSDISSSSDSELDSTDDGGEASRTTSKLSDDQKKEDRRKEEKDKDRSKKKKKKDKHRRKSHTREDGSRRRSERKSRRSGDPVKVERSSRRRSQSRSRIGSAPSNRRSLSHHMEVGRHRERRWGSRSRSRSLNRGHRRSQSPRSKRRRNSREPDDLRSKLKRKKSSEREQSGDQRNRSKGSPERSRARLEKDEYYIDKGKLLEIARKNALSMLRQGQVGGDMNKVVHITAGGKTVDELTDFCKHLSRKDATGMESVSSDSSSDESEKPFHHPFKLKERPSQIIMNIRNCVPLPPKTHQEKATENLRIQFPVSSGQLHRKTESEWVPVPPKKTETKPQPSTSKPKETTAPLAIEAPPVVAGPVVPKYPTVYPTPAEKRAVDIGAVISERLAAIRKDFDTSGSSVFGSSRSWEAPHTTGLFTGSTGAKVLTPTELASGQQAWARKSDQRMKPLEPAPSLLENGCTPEMLALKKNQLLLTLPGGSSREALNKRYGFSTELPDLPPGQLVVITDLKVKGNIVKKLDELRSYLIETKEGRKVVSDRFHLVPLASRTEEDCENL